MSRIEIGRAGSKPFIVDVKALRRTRLLVQANSGGGKSWLLRRMAEQLFGKVPVWIIDPEGEFKSLREKFDFVLVGKGGETPADPRSAELVANKLRELRASVVFDLYDLKPPTRHHYVRVLLEAMMNAPKQLWLPVILKVDEAHMFAPEKGQGESEAFAAMQDVATRGRKRGICMAAYLQRLARLSKTVSAELLNRLVGMTFEDVDVDRAEGVLSVSKSDREQFRTEIKHLHAGQFYGLGPALAKDRTLIQVGDVLTTHPDPDDDSKQSIEPPPPTDKIKALLPKLQDLPKEAEAKAKNEQELRAEIRSLKAQLAARPKETVTETKEVVRKIVVPLVSEAMAKRMEKAIRTAADAGVTFKEAARALEMTFLEATEAERAAVKLIAKIEASPVQTRALHPARPAKLPDVDNPIITRAADAVLAEDRRDVTVSPPLLRILKALAMFEALGFSQAPRTWIAPLADTTHTSSGFEKNVGLLKKGGYVELGTISGTLRITAAGRGEVGDLPAPTHELLVQKCNAAVSGPQGAILNNLIQMFPQDLDFNELAQRSGTTSTSSGFEKNRSVLRTAGMIEYTASGRARAAAWLWPDTVRSA